MGLLTYSNVQAWVPQAAASEELVSDAIAMAEGLAADYCDRAIEAVARTEYYDIGHRQSAIQLRAYPVSASGFAVQVYATSTSPQDVDNDDYTVDAQAGLLQAYPDGCFWPEGVRCVKVTYTGGYTTATLPAGLKAALLQLTAWVLEGRGNVGSASDSVDGRSVTYDPMDGAVPSRIGAMLQPYRRVTF